MTPEAAASIAAYIADVGSAICRPSQTPYVLAAFDRLHRTQQQEVIGACLILIQHMANKPPGEFDGRNEVAGEVCRKIAKWSNETNEVYLGRLPCI